jgi:alkylation response protein AidB-like acyl-CoA dehydrogenase
MSGGAWAWFDDSQHGIVYPPLLLTCGHRHAAATARYGTPEQQKRWLLPLLRGQIRSCFAMTEKLVASSDATNITAAITRSSSSSSRGDGGGTYRVQGLKWWTSGAMDPRCKVRLPAVLLLGEICSKFSLRTAAQQPGTPLWCGS